MNINEWMKTLVQLGEKQTLASLKVGGEKTELCTCCAEKTETGFEVKKTVGALEVRLEGKTYPAYNAVEWVMWLKNTGCENTPEISEIWAADVSAAMEKSAKVAHVGINGDRCSEENFLPFRTPLKVGGKKRVTPNGGRPSNGEFPYFDLQDKKGGVIVAIGWSGQWLYELERTEDAVQLRVGLEDACFYLKPGEEVRTPRVLMKGFAGDPVDGHNEYRHLIFEHYSPKKADGSPVKLVASMCCMERYSYSCDQWNTEEAQKENAAYTAKLKYLDTVWLDASWFTGGFTYGVGNYTFRKGFPNGLRPVSDEARRLGMKFLLWFEPERFAYGTQTEAEHPEWLIKDPTSTDWEPFYVDRVDTDLAAPTLFGLYNLGIPEAQKFLSDRLITFIRKEGIDIFR